MVTSLSPLTRCLASILIATGCDEDEAEPQATELPKCVALQFDASDMLSAAFAGFVSECEDGEAIPLQGSLHRVEAVACESPTSCATDSDCADDQACICSSGFYNGADFLDFALDTRCYPAGCRSDADCGEYTCAPDIPCGTVSELRCHTPNDECTRNVDCGNMPGGTACGWNSAESRWTCLPEVDCA